MFLTRTLSVALAGTAGFALLSTSADAAPSAHRPKAPTPNATARAHGVDATYGATPGWRSKQLTEHSRTTPDAGATARSNAAASTMTTTTATTTAVTGVDVSGWSGTVDWSAFKSQGYRFAYVKASEGNYFTASTYATQRSGAKAAGFITGAYHFANPAVSSGAAQADYLIARSGGWKPGTNSLPDAVDLEWNPYSGNSCYNLTPAQMTAWITSFQQRYQAVTGVYPVIYTAKSWWNTCVSDDTAGAVISARSPLWISQFSTSLTGLARNWNAQHIWQNATVSNGGYDTNIYNGSTNQLIAATIAGR